MDPPTHHCYRQAWPVGGPRGGVWGGVLLFADSTVQRSVDRRDLEIESKSLLEDLWLEDGD